MQPSQIVNRLSLKGTFIIKTRFSKLPFFSYRLNENMKSFNVEGKIQHSLLKVFCKNGDDGDDIDGDDDDGEEDGEC